MTARPLTIPTMGRAYIRAYMPGHRQMVILSRRLAAPAVGQSSPVIEAGRGTETGNV